MFTSSSLLNVVQHYKAVGAVVQPKPVSLWLISRSPVVNLNRCPSLFHYIEGMLAIEIKLGQFLPLDSKAYQTACLSSKSGSQL